MYLPINVVRIVRYLFMNTLQTQAVLSSKSTTTVAEKQAPVVKEPSREAQMVVNKSDRYSASAANDAVVAKVLSFSLNKNVENSMASESSSQTKSLSEKFKLAQQNAAPNFNIQTVTENVVGFVSKALSNLAVQGYDSEKLEYYKNQAISGVEVGIDQAKIELVGLVDDSVFDTIDDTRDLIIGGIQNLSNNKEDYLNGLENASSIATGTDQKFSRIDVRSGSQQTISIDFERSAFKESLASFQSTNMFTTSASNISFSVEGDLEDPNTQAMANLVNKIDGLANSFYRGDIQSSYDKSMALGYSNNELVSLSAELRKSDKGSTTQTYGEIQHMDKADNLRDLTAPRAVAEYLNRYLDVLESNKATLNNDNDFNNIINGLVNQMKDVQVPDLLQAINRFHSFNSKFYG
jgi:hypothetical protein